MVEQAPIPIRGLSENVNLVYDGADNEETKGAHKSDDNFHQCRFDS